MVSTLRTPLRTALFAAGGAALAWLWYETTPAIPIVVVAIVWAAVAATQAYAARLVTTKPATALQLMEVRVVGIGVASAAAAAAVIIIAVELAAGDGVDPAIKEIVTAATAALSAFVTGITISAEDSDEAIGDYVKGQFQARFYIAGQEGKLGMVALPKDSRGLKAVFTSYEYGWTDWSSATRRERIAALEQELRQVDRQNGATPVTAGPA